MNVNRTGYSLIFTLATITLLAITAPKAWAEEAEEFVSKLKTHYQKAPSLKVFALNYHYLGEGSPYST